MKPKSMTSFIAKSVTVLAACAALNASAGTAPVKNPAPPVVEESGALFDSIGATFDAGYDSRYYFRGLWFADNIMWTALNLSVPITDKLTWGIGAAYINTAGTPFAGSKSGFQYTEIDAITNLSFDAGWAKFGMQYQHYFYPDTYGGSFNGGANALADPEFALKDAGELGFTVAVPIQAFNIYAGYYYDLRISGQYFSLGADYTFAVTDWLSIVPSVTAGYGIDYYTGNGSGSIAGGGVVGNKGQSLQNASTSGMTHVLYTLAVPVKLTKAVTWTSYVALNHSEKLRASLNTTQNEVFWGTKLSFAF
ncbi:hypothetical protein [Prosthecobacter sp.]|uniref:hypothetical protein n=1 Tax=Prosthecobacter sp. TaxID=1965333 RepID=UPI002488CBB3|nr:hypothetical protein [Prosthecobacter sp.]MDI1312518.1 hypothetical protein [Prosthecobacter sp.]